MNSAKLIGAVVLVSVALGFLYVRYRIVRPRQEALVAHPAQGPLAPGPSGPSFSGARATAEPRTQDRGPVMIHGPGGPNTPGSVSMPLRPPTDEERKRIREEMFSGLGVTQEQRARIEAIDRKYEGRSDPAVWRQRMTEVAQVLTPEQRQQIGERMRAVMDERLKAVLPPEEREKLFRKVQERIERGELPPVPRP